MTDTYDVSILKVSAVNHFIQRAHCSSTSPSWRPPLSSSPEPVCVSAGSGPSPAASWPQSKKAALVITTQKTTSTYFHRFITSPPTKNSVQMKPPLYYTIGSFPFEDSVSIFVLISPNDASLQKTKYKFKLLLKVCRIANNKEAASDWDNNNEWVVHSSCHSDWH